MRFRPKSIPFARLISRTAVESGLPATEVRKVVDLFLANVRDAAWENGHLVIPHFASIQVRLRKARSIRNVDGSEAQVASHEVMRVRPTKNWRVR